MAAQVIESDDTVGVVLLPGERAGAERAALATVIQFPVERDRRPRVTNAASRQHSSDVVVTDRGLAAAVWLAAVLVITAVVVGVVSLLSVSNAPLSEQGQAAGIAVSRVAAGSPGNTNSGASAVSAENPGEQMSV